MVSKSTVGLAIATALSLGACDTKKSEPVVVGADTAAPASEQRVAHGEEEDCEKATVKLADDKVTAGVTADGRPVMRVGGALGSAPKVELTDLLADPKAYAGKQVRLEGDVSAMCHHRRGWFSIAAADKSGRNIRVLTAPTFLVPAGSVGKSAITEGTVEVVEVSAKFAQHIADEHKLGEPAEGDAPAHQTVLRAAGAEFL